MAYQDTVNQWFETGDYPTEAQFRQKHAWLRWKDEAITIEDIEGLAQFVNAIIQLDTVKNLFRIEITLQADGSYHLDQGDIITAMIIDSPNDTTISIGNEAGGTEIAENIDITGGSPEAVSAVLYAKEARDIHFTGINGATAIIIIKNTQ
jgi:hypothetical protein